MVKIPDFNLSTKYYQHAFKGIRKRETKIFTKKKFNYSKVYDKNESKYNIIYYLV